MGHKNNEKKTTKEKTWFLLAYTGLILLLLPMMITSWYHPLILSDTPQTFGFEDDLNNLDSTSGTPIIVSSPVASGRKAVECQKDDYVEWTLSTPSKTMDLTFKTYFSKLPTVPNEYLAVGEIWELGKSTRQSLLYATFYCDPQGSRDFTLRTRVPHDRIDYVSRDVVYALETKRWYTIRMTADLNTGTHKMYLDGTEIASITDVAIPADVYINFFKLGAGAQGDSIFVTYYDDVSVSLLDPSPPPQQWSLRITSSIGGSTNKNGTVYANAGESLTATAKQAEGYFFSKWILDGADYSTNTTVTIPAQSAGNPHTLHAIFTNTWIERTPEPIWLTLQVIGLCMIGGGGFVWWNQKRRNRKKHTGAQIT